IKFSDYRSSRVCTHTSNSKNKIFRVNKCRSEIEKCLKHKIKLLMLLRSVSGRAGGESVKLREIMSNRRAIVNFIKFRPPKMQYRVSVTVFDIKCDSYISLTTYVQDLIMMVKILHDYRHARRIKYRIYVPFKLFIVLNTLQAVLNRSPMMRQKEDGE
ncbi:hypothetical protein L9F63_014570, partial [Diploptera punctata]